MWEIISGNYQLTVIMVCSHISILFIVLHAIIPSCFNRVGKVTIVDRVGK